MGKKPDLYRFVGIDRIHPIYAYGSHPLLSVVKNNATVVVSFRPGRDKSSSDAQAARIYGSHLRH
jgi:hypothetical protein